MEIMKNKRGLTIVELIVSIALISVALLFLFRILILLRYDESSDLNNSQMIVNKGQIIQLIQNDFIEKKLSKVTCNLGASETTFTFKDGTDKILKLYNRKLIYDIEGRELDEGFVYGGLTITNKKMGDNGYLYFNINVNHDKIPQTNAEEHRINFIYLYKEDITLVGC